LLRLAAAMPDVFDVPRALHLLHFTHTIEAWQGAEQVAAEFARTNTALPGHECVALTASETESWLLSRLGVPNLMGNGLIFTDERLWKPSPPMVPGLRVYDAIYSARLAPGKRHELAAGVESLLLVYAHSLTDSEDEPYRRVKSLLPHAFFANHEAGKGSYQKFDAKMMVLLHGHARVGLCLTAVEGCMRASMEYLLTGLPVVSTRSIGGRDRYLLGGYCRLVPDDPDKVAEAVRELRDLNLDRRRIRSHAAQLLAFDRYNFMLQVNKIAERLFGRDDLLPSFEPLIGAVSRYRPLDDVVGIVRAELDAGSAAHPSG
jgi:hypothetical protein